MNRRNLLSLGSAGAAFALIPGAQAAAVLAYKPFAQPQEMPSPVSPPITKKLFPEFVVETVKTGGRA